MDEKIRLISPYDDKNSLMGSSAMTIQIILVRSNIIAEIKSLNHFPPSLASPSVHAHFLAGKEASEPEKKLIPVVFRWEHGGKNVCI